MSVSISGVFASQSRIPSLLVPAVFALTLFASQGLSAQQAAVIAGRVTDAAGAHLSDVAIRIDNSSRIVGTDVQGRFRLGGLQPGTHTVVAQRIGLGEVRKSVTVAAGQTLTVDFQLQEAAEVLSPLVISATREVQRRNDASATIDVLDGTEIRRTRAAHPAGIMNRIAGVHVSDLSGEGHSMAMRQPITTKPTYLYLEDGIPTRATGFFNHNALYEVNIPQAAGIEVIKGPGTALYGSDAIGGVVNVLTRSVPSAPNVEATLEGGAFGYARVLATGGLTRGADGVRADLNVTRSANWKEEAPFRRQSATLRWDHTGTGWNSKTVLTGSNIDQVDPPALTNLQFQAMPQFNRAPIAYREVQALRASSAIELEKGPSLFSVTPYARYNVMNLLPFWQLTYDPQTWETHSSSLGVLAKYRRDFEPLRTRVILGVDGDFSPGSFFARRALVNTSGTGNARIWNGFTDGEIHYHYDVTYRQAAPYIHAEFSPVPQMRVDVGLRYDWAGYDYHNNLAPLDTGVHRRPDDTSVSYTHLSPKVGASYTFAPWLNTFASYRHGFRAPSQGQLFQQNSAANTVDLEPVKVESYETGIRGQVGTRAVYQLSAYDMTIRDDIITFVTSANTREARNAGRTRHRGLEGSIGLALNSELRLDAAYSVTNQRYVEWRPQDARTGADAIDFSGNRVEQAPRDLGNVLLTYSPRMLRGGRLAAEYVSVGRYAADPANAFYYEGYGLFNLHANVFLAEKAELFARVTNLADKSYAELVAFDAFQRDQYTPGAPRSIYAGIRYTLQ
jgi:iron complex outermembrane receptor protein